MRAEARMKELGLDLEPAMKPVASYALTKQTGNLLFVSAHGPGVFKELAAYKPGPDGQLRVGRDLTVDEGKLFARLTALNCLRSVRVALGDLDRVKQVVKVVGMVNCSDDFGQHPQVIDGCSELLVQVFGEAGLHARTAVGMQGLPRGIPIDIEMILEVE